MSTLVVIEYDDMLTVSNVTAGLRAGAKAGINAGLGPAENYAGNLVPLSAEATYEENPTISYVPLRGEQFLQRMLAPISAEQALLLSRMSTEDVEVLRLLVRRANGLVNPLYSARPTTDGFDGFLKLYVQLREAGKLDIVKSSDGKFEMLLHDYSQEQRNDVNELLKMLGIQRRPDGAATIAIPLQFFVGSSLPDSIDFETPSALEVIDAAASGVEVPAEHLSGGIARPRAAATSQKLIVIHSSRDPPASASVAVPHRGWWFFVDDRDGPSKQGFVILRTLIGLRMPTSF